MDKTIKVVVWNEDQEGIGAYPEGMHQVIADFLARSNEFAQVKVATLPMPEHGLTDEVLNDTDVLLWWGHRFHHMVSDEVVARVQRRVYKGMGLIVLHSGHASKVFSRLMGTETNKLRWRDNGELERVWKIDQNHPIAKGVPAYIEVPRSEMYGEYFHIPAPDELIFISWYDGGEVFRSGCTFTRGCGKIFYFSPGHEEYPIYRMPEIQQILINAVKWAAPADHPDIPTDHTPESPNALRAKRLNETFL